MKKMAKRGELIERPAYRAIRDYAAQLGYKDLIYLNIGEPDFSTPPNIVEAAKKAMDEGFTHYTEERGLGELRETLALKFGEEKKVKIGKDEILVTNGSAEALFITIMSLVDPGDEVILLSPYYPPYLSCVRMASGKPVIVSTDRKTLTPQPETIQKLVNEKTKVIIVNSPCNPTGMVYGKDIIKAIVDIAVDHDFYIISDEVYDRFVYDDEKVWSPSIFDPALERTIIINSFSKTYAMTGWRIGYLIGNKNIIANILKIKGSVNVCASSISQKAALEALKNSDNHVKKMLEEYAKRRKLVLDRLSKIPGFNCPTPKGAFYVFPDISSFERDSLKFTMYLLKEAHVVVSPGKAFGLEGEGHIRISYASSMENLKMAMDRIAETVKNYQT
ncbi:MAG: hypothetical protein B6U77_03655 [Candidatus Hecatellales archaeon ex4484_218]|nr:MAG: hypothetical protein B6U77_03655 [Candidatus Hecatellales archaeon ex4484_218]